MQFPAIRLIHFLERTRLEMGSFFFFLCGEKYSMLSISIIFLERTQLEM